MSALALTTNRTASKTLADMLLPLTIASCPWSIPSERQTCKGFLYQVFGPLSVSLLTYINEPSHVIMG